MKFDCRKALSHRVVLLGGDEETLRRRALHELVQEASGGDDFDLEHFVADVSGPASWIGSCGTAPFLSPRRVSVVRNLLRYDDDITLAGADALPESALLLLVADTEGGDENRQRQFGARLKKWEAEVKRVGGFSYVAHVDESAFGEFIRQEAKALGKTVTPAAVLALQEMTGGSLSAALEELEKLSLFVGSASQITDRDVRAIVLPAREWNVFKLTDAILRGRAGEALEQLKVLVGTGQKIEGPAYSSVLPMLSRQFKLLWQAKAFLDAKASLTSPPSGLVELLPAKTSLLAQKAYPQRLAMESAAHVDFDQLRRCFEVLATAEARMKGLLPLFQAADALEQMILEMTSTFAGRRAA